MPLAWRLCPAMDSHLLPGLASSYCLAAPFCPDTPTTGIQGRLLYDGTACHLPPPKDGKKDLLTGLPGEWRILHSPLTLVRVGSGRSASKELGAGMETLVVSPTRGNSPTPGFQPHDATDVTLPHLEEIHEQSPASCGSSIALSPAQSLDSRPRASN
jgi:hypothetical protein